MQRTCPYCNFEFSSKFSGETLTTNSDFGFSCSNCGAILEEDEEERQLPIKDGSTEDYDGDDVTNVFFAFIFVIFKKYFLSNEKIKKIFFVSENNINSIQERFVIWIIIIFK
ncbi:hypothetical protein Mgra_00006586 [Meloidogyne graminicola]|uniref:Uncharacterized protein n=1 Tax=Meloidogyne graminicola TaxID=189291 RepID=A0A8S9ZLE5_9BILA|nr:hypothetical protein Mgra_00006586 [Meloidogyne graminicola]